MKTVIAVWKVLRTLGHILRGLTVIAVHFPRRSPDQRQHMVQQWAGQMLGVLGIELKIDGVPPAYGPLLLVSNHISWLDILVIHAARHCRFVSKAEVRHWPLIGTLATAAGTLYIERESSRDAMRVVHHMAESLRAGDILAIFPEGTTSDGVSLLPFHANLIQAAVSADAHVQPVALRFVDTRTGQMSLAPCYVGDDTLMGSVWRTLTAPSVTAVVRYGVAQKAQDRHRRAWASALRDEVQRLKDSGST